MRRKLTPEALTFIAERLGKRSPPPLKWLRVLADHPAPVVREGAIYGLAPHVADDQVKRIIERLAYGDSSPGVRCAAREALP